MNEAWITAVRELGALLARDPNDERALLRLGDLYVKANRARAAERRVAILATDVREGHAPRLERLLDCAREAVGLDREGVAEIELVLRAARARADAGHREERPRDRPEGVTRCRAPQEREFA